MTPKTKKPRLKDFESKRLVLRYRTKANEVNQQQGIINYVGKEHIAFNIGRHEFPILKRNIINIQDIEGNVPFETK